MDIVIVGSGKVGFSLAEQLVKEEHNVTVVDSDEEALRRLSPQNYAAYGQTILTAVARLQNSEKDGTNHET